MHNNSIAFVRFCFATTMIFAIAILLSKAATQTAGPLALGVVAFGIYGFAEFANAFLSKNSKLKARLCSMGGSVSTHKYGGFAIGLVVVAYFVALAILFQVLKAIIV